MGDHESQTEMIWPRESGATNCEKHLAGAAGGDLSGVKTDMLGALLTWMQDRRAQGMIFIGVPGCLAADTPIAIRRGKRTSSGDRVYPVAKLYKLFHGGLNRSRTWKKEIKSETLCMSNDGLISHGTISDVVYSGMQGTYRIKVQGREEFRATALHRFATPAGFKKMQDLNVGDYVLVRSNRRPAVGRTVHRKRRQVNVKHHPHAHVKRVTWKANPKGRNYKRLPYATVVMEAQMNSISVESYIRILRSDEEQSKKLTFLDPSLLVHHRDFNPINDDISNLQVMTKVAHDSLHGKDNVRNFGDFTVESAKIELIQFYGHEPTYDICMDGPEHNFLVNGVVVHNSGKSAMAKACGNYANVPTISFDLSGMQDSLVGKSGQNIRNALKVVDAVSSGEVLIIATCNSIQALPPELRRRFTLGIFFFDLPDKEGRKAIWDLYCKRPDLKATGPLSRKQSAAIPNDEGWTGAEIEKCCSIAWRLNKTLVEAAEFIVPVSRSAPEQLASLRRMASGAFIDASKPGVYQFDETQATATRGRQVRVV